MVEAAEVAWSQRLFHGVTDDHTAGPRGNLSGVLSDIREEQELYGAFVGTRRGPREIRSRSDPVDLSPQWYRRHGASVCDLLFALDIDKGQAAQLDCREEARIKQPRLAAGLVQLSEHLSSQVIIRVFLQRLPI